MESSLKERGSAIILDVSLMNHRTLVIDECAHRIIRFLENKILGVEPE